MPAPRYEYLLVLTTCPERAVAERLARLVISERLGACVNVLPDIRSVYPWKGELHSDRECLLLIKTAAGVYPRLEGALRANHPYELPEILAVPIVAGSAEYLEWVRACIEEG